MSGLYGEGEWIAWEGGDCPVPPETVVAWRLRKGHEYDGRNHGWTAGDLDWRHCPDPNPLGQMQDIIAYRVSALAKPNTEQDQD